MFVAFDNVFGSRNRFASTICFVLTLGTLMNVCLLQGARRAAVAEASRALEAPVQTAQTTAQSGIIPAALRVVSQPNSQAPAGYTLNSADADLSVRTATDSETPAEQSSMGDGQPGEKLVSAIQRELASRGYDPGRITGTPGIVTRSAILAYQFDQHLALTAEPSEELLRQIVLGLAGSPAEQSQRPSEKAARIIGGTQRLLVRLGYSPGTIDGQLSVATRKALRHFETDAGFAPKGRVSGEIISELARRAHARIEVSDEALSH